MVGKSEQEQIEDLKQWWEKHGKVVLVGVIFLISGVIGGQVWMDFQESKKQSISNEYSLIMEEMRDGNVDSASQRASLLIEKHGDSAYATFSALALAKMEVGKGELDNAKLRLEWVAQHSEEPSVQALAKLRMAKILLAQKQADAALSQLAGNTLVSFNAAFAIVRGDAYVQKGDVNAARAAYLSALDDKELLSQLRSMVQIKLDNLGLAAAS